MAVDYENLIEISSDTQLKVKFEKVPIAIFWCDIFDDYPNLSKRIYQNFRLLLLFATTCLCKSGFSKYVSTKTKYRNKLDAASDKRIQLSNIEPNFQKILKSKK
jgi:hypothetical protein